MALRDDFHLSDSRMLLNVVLRGTKAEDGRLILFGFALNLPPELMTQSGGKDIHLVAQVELARAGSRVLEDTWREGPEDILENGIPPFGKD